MARVPPAATPRAVSTPRRQASTKTATTRAASSAASKASAATGRSATGATRTSTRPAKKAATTTRDSTRLRPVEPLHIDPQAPAIQGEVLLRAEMCIALLQRRLIKPMSRGGPRGELSLTQYHALSFLAARGQASVGELKDILGFAQSTTSVLVDKLAKLGLVEKLRDRRDHRQASVVALPKGLRMVQRYRKNAERNMLALMSILGEQAVADVFIALENALAITAPLEDPRVTRAALEADDDENDSLSLAAE